MISELQFKSSVSAGRLSNIYFVFGDDAYLIKHYARLIKKKAVPDDNELNIIDFTNEASVQDIYDNIMQVSFTGERICVSVCNFDFESCAIAEFKKLQSIMESAPLQNTLVLYYDAFEINTKKSERFKKLQKSIETVGGIVCEIKHKTESELAKMLCDGAAKRKTVLNPDTARYMISVCSNNLNILINELEKLTSYVGENGHISKETVDNVCVKTLEASVYDMSRHILSGRGEQAFKLLNKLLAQGISETDIFSLIVSSYVDIYRVKSAIELGKKPEEIAKTFGYSPKREFVLTNAAKDAKNISLKQISLIIDELINNDYKIKNEVKETSGSAKIALECLIIKIMDISFGRKNND